MLDELGDEGGVAQMDELGFLGNGRVGRGVLEVEVDDDGLLGRSESSDVDICKE